MKPLNICITMYEDKTRSFPWRAGQVYYGIDRKPLGIVSIVDTRFIYTVGFRDFLDTLRQKRSADHPHTKAIVEALMKDRTLMMFLRQVLNEMKDVQDEFASPFTRTSPEPSKSRGRRISLVDDE